MSHPFIGVSPDGIIDGETVLEIKCPFVVRNQMIHTKTVPVSPSMIPSGDTPING
jgi:hypothetical protein